MIIASKKYFTLSQFLYFSKNFLEKNIKVVCLKLGTFVL